MCWCLCWTLMKTKSAPPPNYSTSAGRDSFGPIQLPGSGQEPSKGCDRSPWQSCNWAPLIIASLGQAGVASGRWWQASYLNVQFKFTTWTALQSRPLLHLPQPTIYVRHRWEQMSDSRFRSVQITLICNLNFCCEERDALGTQCSIILHSTLSPLLYPF